MNNFAKRIRPHVTAELAAARSAEHLGEPQRAFSHLERAHVLGQSSTVEHVRAHWHMLAWAVRQRNRREFVGQLLRLVVAATKTIVGRVPRGNTGGTNVGALEPMAITPELMGIIEEARLPATPAADPARPSTRPRAD